MSTRKHLKKAGPPYLYRHEANKNYYGIKKHDGKIVNKALQTEKGEAITERKPAEAALRKWLDSLDAPEPPKKAPTFRELYDLFMQTKDGKAYNTKKNFAHKFKTVGEHCPQILDMPIDLIKPSDFSVMLAKLEREWKPRSYNSLTLFIKQMFDLAIADDIIEKNPYVRLATKRLKLNDKPAEVPTVEQCEKIVKDIRSQQYADTAGVSADMVEFLHRAALGVAEAAKLVWGDVDFEGGTIQVERQKTGVYFNVPVYAHLRPFLVDLYEREGKPAKGEKIFKVKSVDICLRNACKRLKMPHYSPRDLRKARIVDMLRKGVTPETLSKWQGHGDNGC